MEESESNEQADETPKFKRMSCGLQIECPSSITTLLQDAHRQGYHFVVTRIVHPRYIRDPEHSPAIIGRTDRVLTGQDWSSLVVAQLSDDLEVDSEVQSVRMHDQKLLQQEIGFASHLGIPALLIRLRQARNANLAHILSNKIVGTNSVFQVWVALPLVHPAHQSPIYDEKLDGPLPDTWEWWNDFRRYVAYAKRFNLVLELPPVDQMPSDTIVDRWIGEPIKALVISTSLFMTNQHGQRVLSKVHQKFIQRMMALDVQYIITGESVNGSYGQYVSYLTHLGKKLYQSGALEDFTQGCEDYLQNPLQPLADHLETVIYEVFEKDKIKYEAYQQAIVLALKDLPEDIEPVITIVGAGRGPLIQATLNASYLTRRKCKIYAVEKNPFAINTLLHRVKYEWQPHRVQLVHEDMRTWRAPELADILVSELLGSFGDNELSPECLDGAQRCLKQSGVSIPCSYTSFLAPVQSIKLHNEIKTSRPVDKSLETVYETPYVVHLVNYYKIAPSKALFRYDHPNWSKCIDNRRYKRLQFKAEQSCVLTAFAGFFETTLYKDIMLSINPQTHSPDMVSWFPILFPLQNPIQVMKDDMIEISFWRSESSEKVWYEWCMESPQRGSIANPNGRSYFIKKYL